jgi:hypothetical protein
MKAIASCEKNSVSYSSLCAPLESNADHVLIEAWRKLGKPAGSMTVKLDSIHEITGKVSVSRIGVPYASESRWIRGRRNGQR